MFHLSSIRPIMYLCKMQTTACPLPNTLTESTTSPNILQLSCMQQQVNCRAWYTVTEIWLHSIMLHGKSFICSTVLKATIHSFFSLGSEGCCSLSSAPAIVTRLEKLSSISGCVITICKALRSNEGADGALCNLQCKKYAIKKYYTLGYLAFPFCDNPDEKPRKLGHHI